MAVCQSSDDVVRTRQKSGICAAVKGGRRAIRVSVSRSLRSGILECGVREPKRGRSAIFWGGVAAELSCRRDTGVASSIQQSRNKNHRSNNTYSARLNQKLHGSDDLFFLICEVSQEVSQVQVWGRRKKALKPLPCTIIFGGSWHSWRLFTSLLFSRISNPPCSI